MTAIRDAVRRVATRSRDLPAWAGNPVALHLHIQVLCSLPESRWIAVRKLPSIPFFMLIARDEFAPDPGAADPPDPGAADPPGSGAAPSPSRSLDTPRGGEGRPRVDDRKCEGET